MSRGPTCLRELPHLTGLVIGQPRHGAQGGLPVALVTVAHVADEGAQLGVGRLPGGRG